MPTKARVVREAQVKGAECDCGCGTLLRLRRANYKEWGRDNGLSELGTAPFRDAEFIDGR